MAKKAEFHMPPNLSYGAALKIETAKKMLQAAEKEAERLKVPMSIAICDAGTNLVAFHRMDDAPLSSIQIAQDKAYTAVCGKMATGYWKPLFEGDIVPLHFHQRWVTFWGGYPIVEKKTIVGGIGVSGGSFEDTLVVRAALKAGGYSLTEVKQVIAELKIPDK